MAAVTRSTPTQYLTEAKSYCLVSLEPIRMGRSDVYDYGEGEGFNKKFVPTFVVFGGNLLKYFHDHMDLKSTGKWLSGEGFGSVPTEQDIQNMINKIRNCSTILSDCKSDCEAKSRCKANFFECEIAGHVELIDMLSRALLSSKKIQKCVAEPNNRVI